jgi:cell division protein FtsA
MAKIEIADSFNAARIEAEYILNEEELGAGTALVNIGADTTTVSIYSNRLLRKITVIPLGSANITKDLCSEQITLAEAEQMKIFKGYNSSGNDNSSVPTNILNDVISGRMSEILQNTKNQIENSGENIGRIVFTGGGSKLKNLETIIEENLPNYKTRIANDIKLSFIHSEELPITTGSITPTLLGLLSKGNENCCEEEILTPKDTVVPDSLFADEENLETETPQPVPDKKESNYDKGKNNNSPKKKPGAYSKFKDIFSGWIDGITEEEESNANRTEEEL